MWFCKHIAAEGIFTLLILVVLGRDIRVTITKETILGGRKVQPQKTEFRACLFTLFLVAEISGPHLVDVRVLCPQTRGI